MKHIALWTPGMNILSIVTICIVIQSPSLTCASGVLHVAAAWAGLSNTSWVLSFGAAWERPPVSPWLDDIRPILGSYPGGGAESQDLEQPHAHRLTGKQTTNT